MLGAEFIRRRPRGAGSTELIVAAIDGARREVTSPPILRALVGAHRRGVDVRAVLDEVIVIIDRELVITGSLNLTRSAEARNVEDLVLISLPAVAAQFVANWTGKQTASTA